MSIFAPNFEISSVLSDFFCLVSAKLLSQKAFAEASLSASPSSLAIMSRINTLTFWNWSSPPECMACAILDASCLEDRQIGFGSHSTTHDLKERDLAQRSTCRLFNNLLRLCQCCQLFAPTLGFGLKILSFGHAIMVQC